MDKRLLQYTTKNLTTWRRQRPNQKYLFQHSLSLLTMIQATITPEYGVNVRSRNSRLLNAEFK